MALPSPSGPARGPASNGAGAPAPALAFSVEHAEPLAYAAVPTLRFALRVERVGGGPVRSLSLDTQIRIAATKRRYDEATKDRLIEVFGRPEQWGRTLHGFVWARAALQVPAFTDAVTVDLHVVCTYDFEVVSAKYLHALEDGEVPLELLFSGTVFYAGAGGGLQVARLSWEHEAEYRLPVAVWRETMDRHFPGSAWLRLDRERFDRLYAFKAQRLLPTWEAAVDALLDAAEGPT